MRDPVRVMRRFLAVLAAGLAVMAGGILLAVQEDRGWLGLVILVGLLATFAGLIGALVLWGQPRLQRGLLARRDLIARWRVGPDRWSQFRALEARLAATPPRNEFQPRIEAAAPRSIEVLVGREAVLVDGDFFALRDKEVPVISRAEIIFGPPLCIEIGLYYPPGGDPVESFENVLRFPVGAGADDAAARVRAHFARLVPPQAAAAGVSPGA